MPSDMRPPKRPMSPEAPSPARRHKTRKGVDGNDVHATVPESCPERPQQECPESITVIDGLPSNRDASGAVTAQQAPTADASNSGTQNRGMEGFELKTDGFYKWYQKIPSRNPQSSETTAKDEVPAPVTLQYVIKNGSILEQLYAESPGMAPRLINMYKIKANREEEAAPAYDKVPGFRVSDAVATALYWSDRVGPRREDSGSVDFYPILREFFWQDNKELSWTARGASNSWVIPGERHVGPRGLTFHVCRRANEIWIGMSQNWTCTITPLDLWLNLVQFRCTTTTAAWEPMKALKYKTKPRLQAVKGTDEPIWSYLDSPYYQRLYGLDQWTTNPAVVEEQARAVASLMLENRPWASDYLDEAPKKPAVSWRVTKE